MSHCVAAALTAWAALQSPDRVRTLSGEARAPRAFQILLPANGMENLVANVPKGPLLLVVEAATPGVMPMAAVFKRRAAQALGSRGFEVTALPVRNNSPGAAQQAALEQPGRYVVWFVVAPSNNVDGQVDVTGHVLDATGERAPPSVWEFAASPAPPAMFVPQLSEEKLRRDAGNLAARFHLLIAEVTEESYEPGDVEYSLRLYRERPRELVRFSVACERVAAMNPEAQALCDGNAFKVAWKTTAPPQDAWRVLALMEAYNRNVVMAVGGDTADLPVDYFPSEALRKLTPRRRRR